MDTEQSMKQTFKFSQELCCHEAENIVFCKILRMFSNSAQFTKFCEKFYDRRILVGLHSTSLNYLTHCI